MIAGFSIFSITAIVVCVAVTCHKRYKVQRSQYLKDLHIGDVVQYLRLCHVVAVKIARIDRDNRCIYTRQGKKIDYSQIITQ